MPDIATAIIAKVLEAGGSFRATGYVDLLTVKRSLLGWFSESIQNAIGVPNKPVADRGAPRASKTNRHSSWIIWVLGVSTSPQQEEVISE